MRFFLLFMFISLAFPAPVLANEGSGLISSDLNGALPKALWRNQKRSEILELLKNMPADAPLRSIQKIKRDTLLSQYETRLINNDIKPSHENNFLTLRLQKLVEMGQWEDAFRLYTMVSDDPKDNYPLAHVGITLVLLEKGVATACLEAKVLGNNAPQETFWKQIDDVCSVETGTLSPSTADFAGSNTLQNIYRGSDFQISANDIETLSNLSKLELALLSTKNRINYENISLKRKTPPHIIKTFIKDSKFPPSQQQHLNNIAEQQAILPLPPLDDVDNIDDLDQEKLIRIIVYKLKENQKISDIEYDKLRQLAPNNPENYFYLTCLSLFQPIEKEQKINEGDFLSSIYDLSIKFEEKVDFFKSLLDKQSLFSNNPANAYEKHVSNNFNEPLVVRKSEASQFRKDKKAGLSLLIVLSNIENRSWVKTSVDTSTKTTFNMLKNLSEVGLIDQTHQIAKEELANLMMLYKN